MKNKLIVITLILFWLFLTALFIYQTPGLTLLSKDFGKEIFTNLTFSEFLKGEKIQGEFSASENYLGQFSVRFYNYDRINSDEVGFRLKEKGTEDWYYEHIYKTDQFQPNQLFPFGFPIIQDSRGKQYVFEIESVKGKSEDAVTLSHQEPMVSTSYQYPKRLILKDKNVLFEFLTKKASHAKIDLDFAVSFSTYINVSILSVLLLYIFLQYLFKHGVSVFRFNGSHTVSLGIIFLTISFTLLYLRKRELSETISIASYFLFVLGVIIMLIEAKKSKK